MTSVHSAAVSSDPVPDLGRLLDCLTRIDGKARVIVDRRGTVKAASVHAPGATDSDAWRASLPLGLDDRESLAKAKLARLLAVRGEDTELAVMDDMQGGHMVVVRAGAIDAEHVCLVLTTSGQSTLPRVAELQKLFGLTESEAGIVKGLMEGCAPQAIAAQRRKSIHTIRTQIRQCHLKIGVRTREELLSRVAGLCI